MIIIMNKQIYSKQRDNYVLKGFMAMMYDTQIYWVFGFCPSSGILKNLRSQPFGNWVCFRPQVREEIHTP
jgi:hypothetical protein